MKVQMEYAEARKSSRKPQGDQLSRFLETAHRAGCDEAKDQFEAKVGKSLAMYRLLRTQNSPLVPAYLTRYR